MKQDNKKVKTQMLNKMHPNIYYRPEIAISTEFLGGSTGVLFSSIWKNTLGLSNL